MSTPGYDWQAEINSPICVMCEQLRTKGALDGFPFCSRCSRDFAGDDIHITSSAGHYHSEQSCSTAYCGRQSYAELLAYNGITETLIESP